MHSLIEICNIISTPKNTNKKLTYEYIQHLIKVYQKRIDTGKNLRDFDQRMIKKYNIMLELLKL